MEKAISQAIREAFREGFEEGHASAAAEAQLWEGWDEAGAWETSESRLKASGLVSKRKSEVRRT